MTTNSTAPDRGKSAEALVTRLSDASLGMFDVMAVYLGDRLGLYRALRDDGPATSADGEPDDTGVGSPALTAARGDPHAPVSGRALATSSPALAREKATEAGVTERVTLPGPDAAASAASRTAKVTRSLTPACFA